eukprot:scaffold134135_cov35-Prasinocladus_malaysianus.AAC.1
MKSFKQVSAINGLRGLRNVPFGPPHPRRHPRRRRGSAAAGLCSAERPASSAARLDSYLTLLSRDERCQRDVAIATIYQLSVCGLPCAGPMTLATSRYRSRYNLRFR